MLSMSKFNSKTTKLALGLVFAASLAACGGGDDYVAPPATAAASNVSLVSTAANGAVMAPAFVSASPTPIVFTNGFSGVDANGATVTATAGTAVTFSTGTATSPTASFTDNGKTATATTTFGSCTFTFAANSPFVAPHPFAPGKTFKVDPCSIQIPTANSTANGVAQNLTAEITFGTTKVSKVLPVVVSANGDVSVGGLKIATVTVVATTGGAN